MIIKFLFVFALNLLLLVACLRLLAVIMSFIQFIKYGEMPCYLRLDIVSSEDISENDWLKIACKDCPVDTPSIVGFDFLNNGKKVITESDVTEKISLSVPEGYRIYHAEVIDLSEPEDESGGFSAVLYDSNGVKTTISEDKRKVDVTFRCIFQKQCIGICFLSDCDKIEDYELQGAVKGKKLKLAAKDKYIYK